MKLKISDFKGMLPIRANSKLPPGYASSAINTKLISGDVEGYLDFGNGFQLAKSAPIFTLDQAANGDWLQFNASELASFAFDIRAQTGIIAGDTTGRRYITGYNALTGGAYPSAGVFQGPAPNSVPQFTNTYYATDSSQQGSSAAGAYPYKTFPLGIADPLTDPSVTAPAAGGTVNYYEFAQPASVNNVVPVAAGTDWAVGDYATIGGGTIAPGFSSPAGAAQIQVTAIGAGGSITGQTLTRQGFYVNGAAPSGTVSLTAVAPSAGTGATVSVTANPAGNAFSGFGTYFYSGGGGSFSQWAINGGGQWQATGEQGDLSTAYSEIAWSLETASAFTVQVDGETLNNGNSQYGDMIVGFASTYVVGGSVSDAGAGGLLGPGVILSKDDGTFTLYSKYKGTNSYSAVSGTIVNQATGLTIAGNTLYRISVTATSESAASTPGFSVTATLAALATPSMIIATVTGFIPYSGENIGLGMNQRSDNSHPSDASFQNLLVTITQPASAVTVESTNYVYTYVQQIPLDVLTQESGPSDPSATVDIYIDATTNPATRTAATITIPAAPSGEFVTYYNLYRLVEDSSGNETYTFVTQLSALNLTSVSGTFSSGDSVTGTAGATATVLGYSTGVLTLSGIAGLFQIGDTITDNTSGAHGTYASPALSSTTMIYVDSAQDSAIGPDVLISQDWAPPPAQMQGIVAVANSCMAGFVGNILCFSAPGYPHAWPVENQYSIDTGVQGLIIVDTTVLITSEAYPYTAWGTDPSAYSMSKEVSIQGNTAPRSIATHKEYGAIFASGNGFCYYKGQGQLGLIRIGPYNQPPFSYEQFQALAPSSIVGVLHDDYYFFFWKNGSLKGGYVLDLTQTGFGLIALDVHATEAFVDKAVDALWMTLDLSTYPVPAAGSPVASAQNIVYQWEGAATQRPRVWTRSDNLFGNPFSPIKARVQSQYNGSTDTITLTLASEWGTAYNSTVAQQRSFTIGCEPGFSWSASLTVTGTARIKTLDVVESPEELADNG